MRLSRLTQPLSAARKTANSIRRMVKSPSRKPFSQIASEWARCYREQGGVPAQYLLNELYHRDVTDPHAFIEAEALRCMNKAGGRSPAGPILNNKLHFHLYFQGSGVRLPRLFGHTYRHRIKLEGRTCWVEPGEPFRQFALGLLEEVGGGIIVKPVHGAGGIDVLRLRPGMPHEELDEVGEAMATHAFILEEEVRQHADLSRIFPHCLNTIRIINGVLPTGEALAVSALIRFGAGLSYIDNASRGGFFVGVDLATGELSPYARRFFEYGGGRFTSHPDTGFVFGGYRIPFFDEAMALTEEALRLLPSPLVGWDVGITPEGPVLIEGNARPNLVGAELSAGGFRYNAAFQKLASAYRKG